MVAPRLVQIQGLISLSGLSFSWFRGIVISSSKN
jgi:hypothetical protein